MKFNLNKISLDNEYGVKPALLIQISITSLIKKKKVKKLKKLD